MKWTNASVLGSILSSHKKNPGGYQTWDKHKNVNAWHGDGEMGAKLRMNGGWGVGVGGGRIWILRMSWHASLSGSSITYTWWEIFSASPPRPPCSLQVFFGKKSLPWGAAGRSSIFWHVSGGFIRHADVIYNLGPLPVKVPRHTRLVIDMWRQRMASFEQATVDLKCLCAPFTYQGMSDIILIA